MPSDSPVETSNNLPAAENEPIDLDVELSPQDVQRLRHAEVQAQQATESNARLDSPPDIIHNQFRAVSGDGFHFLIDPRSPFTMG